MAKGGCAARNERREHAEEARGGLPFRARASQFVVDGVRSEQAKMQKNNTNRETIHTACDGEMREDKGGRVEMRR